MEVQPTVLKIKSESSVGFAFINEADFVEGEHELFDAPLTPVTAKVTPNKKTQPKASSDDSDQ